MGPFNVLWLATIAGGVALGYWIATMQQRLVYKRFSKEMHKQYLYLLKRHGVTLNSEGEELLNEPDYKPEREEEVLRMRSEDGRTDDRG